MEKLKIALVGVVLLLAVAVVYGLVSGDDGDEDSGPPASATRTAPPADAPPAAEEAPPSREGGGEAGAPADEAEGVSGGSAAAPSPGGDGSSEGGPSGGQGGAPAEPDRASNGDGGKPAEKSSPSKAVFIVRVDKVCGRVPGNLQKHARQYEKGASATDSVEIFRRAAPPALREAAREIDRLTPPSGDAKDAAKLVAALERAASKVEAYPSSGVTTSASPFTEFSKLAGGYGLKRCSQF